MATCIDVVGAFCKVEFIPVNLNSHDQVKGFLLTQGWRPTNYTDNGSPQLTEDSYKSIKGELGQTISKRAVLMHRAQMLFSIDKKYKLKGLLNAVRVDGRIEGGAETNGTNTGRMRHRGVVNIPKPKDFGLWPSDAQIRSLFIVPEGRVLVGVDADALEAKMEAHACLPYPGGKEYAKELTEGDIHANNAIIFGTDRDGAKSPKYALTYGCTEGKLAETLGCSIKKAKQLYKDFWEGNTALDGFKKAITKFWKNTGKKYIIGIDGRKIGTRSEHSLVNAYFQSTGSITVKVAALFLDKWERAEGLDVQQVLIVHDEVQHECAEEDAERVGELARMAFAKAGEFLGIRVPTSGSPKFGKNWQETH